MSRGDDDAEGNGAALPAVQTVGYGQPPAEHRFQKGQSGNPKGRPRGSRSKERPVYDPANRPTSRLILEEAYRPVAIREGHEVFEIPAIQAVMRAMGVAAMKGNRLAQKNLTEIVQRVEAAEHAERMETLENFLTYKKEWTDHIEKCERAGIPDSAPLPHPDDVILDLRQGTIEIKGPISKEEKIRWDTIIARRSVAQEEVTYFAAEYRRARSPAKKDLWLEEWHFEQRMFDIINDTLPDRYKIKLADRSYHAGATREGHALSEYLANRKGRGKRGG